MMLCYRVRKLHEVVLAQRNALYGCIMYGCIIAMLYDVLFCVGAFFCWVFANLTKTISYTYVTGDHEWTVIPTPCK